MTPADFDDIDAELDRYADYEAQFSTHTRRKTKANHKPKKSHGAVINSMVAEADGLEGGFNTTYVPGLFEKGWLLESLRPFYEMGLITDVLGKVKGGKEANVYRVQGSANLNGRLLAAKVYRPQIFRTMKNDSAYREGRNTLTSEGHVIKKTDTRIMRALGKKSDFGVQVAHTSWLMHEYSTLQKLHAAGALVPQAFGSAENAILMDYRGSSTLAAPLLAEIQLDEAQATAAFDRILDTVKTMLQLGVVHGDLSAYNVLYWDDEPTVIDFPQVLDVHGNASARDYLLRDITRLCDYFAGCGDERDPNEITESLWPYTQRMSEAQWNDELE